MGRDAEIPAPEGSRYSGDKMTLKEAIAFTLAFLFSTGLFIACAFYKGAPFIGWIDKLAEGLTGV